MTTRLVVAMYQVQQQARAKARGCELLADRIGRDSCLRTAMLIEGDRYPTMIAHWPVAVIHGDAGIG